MKIGLGRYRLRIQIRDQADPDRANQAEDRDLTDSEIARLTHAEREYHDTLWKPQSIIDGVR